MHAEGGSVQAQDIPSEFVNIAVYNEEGDVDVMRHVKIENPPSSVEELVSLPSMSKKTLERSLARGDIAQVCVIVEMVDEGFVNTASSADADVLDEKTRKERFEEQSWDALKKNPVYALAREYEDIFPDKVPDELPFDRGIRHEIDVLPGTKYCITRQWPLPKEQVEAIDEFFAQHSNARRRCSTNRSEYPEWYAVGMVSDATGTEEWLLRPSIEWSRTFFVLCETFAPSYFDDIFVHIFQVMRENKLYANLKKCMFFAPEIPVLGCFVGKSGVRVDPEKVKAIDDWPVPQNVKQLRQWLGLANYLHKYTRNYAALVQPLTQLLKKDVEWKWSKDHETAFEEVKRGLREAPVLALPNHDKPFHVVCDASDYAIGCALMQHDDEGHERVVSYQSRQLRPAERNYPVHDKELLAMKYSLVKFRVYLLGEERFAIYTDHASLRTAVKTPHLSQMNGEMVLLLCRVQLCCTLQARQDEHLSRCAVKTSDYDPKTKSEDTDGACRLCEDVQAIAVRAATTVREEIVEGYKSDETCRDLLKYFKDPSDKALQGLPSRTRSRVHRFRVHNGLLYYAVEQGDTARIVVPNDEDVYDRDTRFTSKFWRALFGLLDTKLSLSTAAHPETDSQTERVNRVLEDVLRSYATSFKEWSDYLPLAEFALNNSTHASTGHSPFYVNYGIHPRVPASIMGEVSTLSGGGTPAHGNKPKSSYDLNAASELKANFDSMKPLDDLTSREEQQVDDFVVRRQAVVRFVRDAIAKAQDLQKEQADKSGRKNKQVYKINDLVLLSTVNLHENACSKGKSEASAKVIGKFKSATGDREPTHEDYHSSGGRTNSSEPVGHCPRTGTQSRTLERTFCQIVILDMIGDKVLETLPAAFLKRRTTLTAKPRLPTMSTFHFQSRSPCSRSTHPVVRLSGRASRVVESIVIMKINRLIVGKDAVEPSTLLQGRWRGYPPS
ncbi:reverse transcriptase, partial [Globisporangium splendens]